MEYKFSQLFTWSSGKPITPTDGDIPVYGSNGIIGYTATSKYNNKIILGRVGAYCGSVEYCPNDFNATDNTLITTCDESKILYPYAYFLLKQYKLNGFAGGAAQPLITQGLLKHLKCDIPDIVEQKRIADILSTYDELIENNNKRIKLLEQMAENLYKEWFVRFRFPGYENAEFENGIPVGWEVKRLGDELTIKRGGSPRPIQDYITENGLKWLKISDATKTDNPFIFNIEESIKEEGLKKTVYRKAGSLVLSNSATPGIPRILSLYTCIHDGWLYFENQKLSNEFLFLFFNHIRPQLVNKGNGAVFTNLKTDILKKYSFVRPADDILSQFDAIVQPLFKQIYSITQQNNNLIKQRDLLLPRLMSGKLEVRKTSETDQKAKVISFEQFVSNMGMAARAKSISDSDLKAMYEAYIDDDATD